MQIIKDRTEFNIDEKTAVAIGKFDGIHKGHGALLTHILKQKEKGLLSVVFTFNPPAAAFFGKPGEKELTTLPEKRKYFEKIGIDILIEFPLDKETAAMPPEIFVKRVLSEQINAGYIAAGADVTFGFRGLGNKELLLKMAGELSYEIEIIDKVLYQGREISSTYVREEVEKGNMETAARLLGRSYSVEGKVSEGSRLGRRLGMPTVNLYPLENKLLPPKGVYYSQVVCDGKVYNGITNIGNKPTVNDTSLVSVETYLYDYTGNMYGKEIVTKLLHFKRPECKFPSVEALKAHMSQDIEEGLKFHNSAEN